MIKKETVVLVLFLVSFTANVILISRIQMPVSDQGSSREERIRFADRSAKLAADIELKSSLYTFYGDPPPQTRLLTQYGALLTDEVPTLRSKSILLLMRYGKSDQKEIESIAKRRLLEEKHPEVFRNVIYSVIHLDPTYLPELKQLVESRISEPDLRIVFESEYEGLKELAKE